VGFVQCCVDKNALVASLQKWNAMALLHDPHGSSDGKDGPQLKEGTDRLYTPLRGG
jgi:hypothetical protein